MLYLGHFSFSYESRIGGNRPEPWLGHFTAAAEARTAHEALKKFEALAQKMAADGHEVFDDVEVIYLESCIEVRAMPRAGFIGQVDLQQGSIGVGISATLPNTAQRNAVSYHLEPESEEEDGTYEPRPFTTLKKRARGTKRTR
jgi:hypothetical protein